MSREWPPDPACWAGKSQRGKHRAGQSRGWWVVAVTLAVTVGVSAGMLLQLWWTR